MELRKLKSFLVVAKELHFGRAAEKLNITQPALTHQIQQLESELGYELFVENKAITHITTNLSASEIEKAYGNRVRSRLRQMFNLIAFDKNAKDKR